MNRNANLATALVTVLVATACGGRPDSSTSTERPGPEPSARETPAPSRMGAPTSLSGLTGRIVFDNHDDVWVINADGTDLTQLTEEPGFDFDPSWSADGTRIAYRRESDGDTEIWLMQADGSEKHKLTDGLSPAWSPDGALIAFAGPKGTTGIITLIRPDGTGIRQLPNTEGGEYPTWSPDGTRVAFNSNLSGTHVMYVAQVDGSNVGSLADVGEGWQVDWSADGSSILFTSERDHSDHYTDVYVMRPDGTGIRRLTTQGAYTPAWSPDGAHIVFSAPGLFVMNLDGSDVSPIPTSVGETSLPDWTE